MSLVTERKNMSVTKDTISFWLKFFISEVYRMTPVAKANVHKVDI